MVWTLKTLFELILARTDFRAFAQQSLFALRLVKNLQKLTYRKKAHIATA